ncbi:unnamed protein product [Lactuca virosa]|uniref:ABC transporter domain-containing protein n=1 Tax=Lactuca virosa TaxID=75947 RepID=A0AAU9MF93_9ASTR|nr:unnamed protein product [Lactuca virosa]
MDEKGKSSVSESLARSISRGISMASPGWRIEDVFSPGRGGSHDGRTSRNSKEDEEALRWAALEKLPTYSRKFIDKIFMDPEEDNDKFLKKFRDRVDKAGITLPTVEVRFQNLSIEADCHVGDRALQTLINSARNIVESFFAIVGINFSQKAKLHILKDASGVIRPSRLALLLGPPSSGKTTLLLALAGRLDHSLKVDGEITYNGHKLNEFEPRRTAGYISQNDIHAGEMTVKETLDFSARCQGIGSRLGSFPFVT